MVKRDSLIYVGMLIAVAAAFYAGWHGGHAQRAHETARAVASASARKDAPVESKINASLRSAGRYEALRQAAASGDAAAAYALAQGEQACYDLPWARLAEPTDDPKEHSAAQERLARDEAACVGDTQISMAQAREAWSLAAALGSRDAQLYFATHPSFSPFAVADDLDYLRDWRSRAPGYLETAAISGDLRAVLTLALASDPTSIPSSPNDDADGPLSWAATTRPIQPQDPALAYRYYLLYRMLGSEASFAHADAAISRLQSNLTPKQVLAAQQWAQNAYATRGATPSN